VLEVLERREREWLSAAGFLPVLCAYSTGPGALQVLNLRLVFIAPQVLNLHSVLKAFTADFEPRPGVYMAFMAP
jgi:hypothetical protein